MSVPNSSSKFISMLIVLASLFIFVFFTQGYYSTLVGTTALLDDNGDEYNKKIEILRNIKVTSDDLKKLEGSKDNEIEKYLNKVSEDSIIKEMYGFAERYGENGVMQISGIGITEGKKSELGFDESRITIKARVQNKKVMIDFLNFLINESQYKFYMNSFTYPKDINGPFNIKVPLIMLYKDIQLEKKEKSSKKK